MDRVIPPSGRKLRRSMTRLAEQSLSALFQGTPCLLILASYETPTFVANVWQHVQRHEVSRTAFTY